MDNSTKRYLHHLTNQNTPIQPISSHKQALKMRWIAAILLIITILSLQYTKTPLTTKVKEGVIENYEELMFSWEKFKLTPTKTNFQSVRNNFKKVEKYVHFFYPNTAKNISGFSFIVNKKEGLVTHQFSQHGLLAIENLMENNSNMLFYEINILDKQLSALKHQLDVTILSKGTILDVNRVELMKVATLGITGYLNLHFSDPHQETIINLLEINREISLFENSNSFSKRIFHCVKTIKSSNYTSLDQVTLIEKDLGPAYQKLCHLYEKEGYTIVKESEPFFPLNYEAKTAFIHSFLTQGITEDLYTSKRYGHNKSEK